MQSNPNTSSSRRPKILLDIPARDADLFRSQTIDDILVFLTRHPVDEFSITELTDAVDYSQPTVSKAVDSLVANDLAVDRRDGTTRLVRINRDRLSRPDDPFLEIPQSEFHEPVRAAVTEVRDQLDDVLGIVLYGSVARGKADRRSDIVLDEHPQVDVTASVGFTAGDTPV